MERIQSVLYWVIVVSASSHIFCCVLPTAVSLLGLVTGVGMISSSLPWFEHVHHVIHRYETPLLVFSGMMLALGWGVQMYSQHIDCHDTGCTHGSCAPQKKRAALILYIATGLFVFNILSFLFLAHDAPHIHH